MGFFPIDDEIFKHGKVVASPRHSLGSAPYLVISYTLSLPNGDCATGGTNLGYFCLHRAFAICHVTSLCKVPLQKVTFIPKFTVWFGPRLLCQV